MKKCFLGLACAYVVFYFGFNVYADNTLQFRQFIGANAICGWYHNEQYLGTEVIYNNKPRVLLGIGPRYTFTQGNNGLKLFGYFALTSNVAKNKIQWPIEKVEIDSFVVPKIGNWSVCLRTRVGLDLANNNSQIYWGEDYIGYQISKTRQIQLRTEWKYSQDLWLQSIGPAWGSEISSTVRFNGYIGIETKRPYAKTGWLELIMVSR